MHVRGGRRGEAPSCILCEAGTRYWDREQYDHITDNHFSALSTIHCRRFRSTSTARRTANAPIRHAKQLPPKGAVRIEEFVNYFEYDYDEPRGDDPFAIHTEIAGCPWSPEHRLVRIGLQGKRIAPDKMPPSNLVFLIDVSGSMADANKLRYHQIGAPDAGDAAA